MQMTDKSMLGIIKVYLLLQLLNNIALKRFYLLRGNAEKELSEMVVEYALKQLPIWSQKEPIGGLILSPTLKAKALCFGISWKWI